MVIFFFSVRIMISITPNSNSCSAIVQASTAPIQTQNLRIETISRNIITKTASLVANSPRFTSNIIIDANTTPMSILFRPNGWLGCGSFRCRCWWNCRSDRSFRCCCGRRCRCRCRRCRRCRRCCCFTTVSGMCYDTFI